MYGLVNILSLGTLKRTRFNAYKDSWEFLMIEIFLNTIEKYNLIEKDECIVVGVSGGPDSVCLLHLLNSIRDIYNINIYVMHINHMLRGIDADSDEQYVSDMCKRLDIPFEVARCDVKSYSIKNGISLEEAGRDLRYEQFNLFAQKKGATKIAVAHNKNDQVETVLMHIIRGTGIDGLKGMEYRNKNIIRPLLDIDRIHIEEYCDRNLLKPRTDSSNLEKIFNRNKIRLEFIPSINNEFKTNIIENVARMTGIIKDDCDFLEGYTLKAYNDCVQESDNNGVSINIAKLMEYHIAIRKRVLRNAVKSVKGDLKGIENTHIDSIQKIIISNKTGKEIQLPKNIRAFISYNILKIYAFEETIGVEKFIKQIEIPGSIVLEDKDCIIEATVIESVKDIFKYKNANNSTMIQFFDYESLNVGINIRNRRDGDVFKPYKSNGTKKLKEYFIDNKIPRDIRDNIPLITRGNEVVWIIGYKINDKFKVTENTKKVLKLEYRKYCKV